MSHSNYKPTIPLYNCNQNIQKTLGPLACGISRAGGSKKRRTLKGGNRCLVPPNPTPSSYWPQPPNPVPPPNCQFPHFRPLVLSQFGGSKKKRHRRNRRLGGEDSPTSVIDGPYPDDQTNQFPWPGFNQYGTMMGSMGGNYRRTRKFRGGARNKRKTAMKCTSKCYVGKNKNKKVGMNCKTFCTMGKSLKQQLKGGNRRQGNCPEGYIAISVPTAHPNIRVIQCVPDVDQHERPESPPRGGRNYKKTKRNKKGGRWIVVPGTAPGQFTLRWIDEYDTDEDD